MFPKRKNKMEGRKDEALDGLETESQKKSRIRSLYIVHTSMLVVSLGSSIIFTGVYPYLVNLDDSVDLTMYGVVVAADAAAQMIFSPILGILTDRWKSVRLVSLLCCTSFCAGNILYSLVGMFNRDQIFGTEVAQARVWVMIVSRFIVGTGTAINSTGRYYVSMATRVEERTTHIALLSLFQTLGFIMGPGLQAALSPIGRKTIGAEGEFFVDMYTSTGLVSASTGLLCLIMYMPGIFEENYIALKEISFNKSQETSVEAIRNRRFMRLASRVSMGPSRADQKTANPKMLLKSYSRISVIDGGMNFSKNLENMMRDEEDSDKTFKFPPILPTITCTFSFFSFLFNFVLLETIVTPLAMDQWGWEQEEAIFNIGMVMIGGGVLSLFVFATIGPLSKRFDERLLLLAAGVTPMIIGRAVMFPFPGAGYPEFRTEEVPPLSTVSEMSTESILGFSNASIYSFLSSGQAGILRDAGSGVGCRYDWCHYIPKVTIPQFMIGYVMAVIGYPFCITLTASIYSKVLGNIPQGFWLGLLTTSGSLARVIGPIFVTAIYKDYGLYLTFALVTGSLVVVMAVTLLAYKQLVPAST